MKTGPITQAAKSALSRTITDLMAAGAAAPQLLRTLHPPDLQARGALLEAVVPLDEIDAFLEALPGGADDEFDRIKFLLFDSEDQPVGTIGFVREGGELHWSHFTEGGAEPIVEGLRRAERFEEESGGRFEARLLLIPEIFQEALVLVPEEPEDHGEPLFVPLEPSFGLTRNRPMPMDEQGFRVLLRDALATLPQPVAEALGNPEVGTAT